MLCYLKHESINQQAWDQCLIQSIKPVVYAQSWYLNIVAPGWGAIVLMSTDKTTYQAIFPITWRKKWGFRYVFTPYFTQQLGLFTTPEYHHEALYLETIQLLNTQFRFIQTYFHTHTIIPDTFKHAITPLPNQFLMLNQPYSQIKKNYHTNRLRNLKKAIKAQLSVVETTEMQPLIDMYIEAKTDQAHFKGYRTLNTLYQTAKSKHQAQLLSVVNKEHVCLAGGLFLFFDKQIISLFHTANQIGKHTGAQTLLMDYVIQTYANKDYLYFDWEGSHIPTIAHFNQSFGSQTETYYLYYQNRLPWPLNLLKKRNYI
jgi:hypothetical protein